MALSIKLQSPNYKTSSSGDQIALPVVQDTERLSSLAAQLAGLKGVNAIIDFGQLRRVVSLQGFLTDQAVADAQGQINGVAETPANAVRWRDMLYRCRTLWPTQAVTVGQTWATGITVSAEQDASTTRKTGTTRLIFDKTWNASAGVFDNFFLYGTVGDLQFGPRASAIGRTRIPFSLNFLVGSVKTES